MMNTPVSAGDALTILYYSGLLFTLGFWLGRGTARPKETWQHRLGVELSKATDGWRSTKAFVGEPVLVTRLLTLTTQGHPEIELVLREPTIGKPVKEPV